MDSLSESFHAHCETPPVSLETAPPYQDDEYDVDQQTEVSLVPYPLHPL